jgi:DNA-binding winged helix-turn-helix (wHTH) protein
MLDLTKEQRTISKQRERIEELEETIRQLREEKSSSAVLFPVEWGLGRGLSQILASLYNAPGGFVEKDQLAAAAAVFRGTNQDDQLQNLLKVQMVRLRRAVLPLGVTIKTVHGSGYALPIASKTIIKEALERRAES